MAHLDNQSNADDATDDLSSDSATGTTDSSKCHPPPMTLWQALCQDPAGALARWLHKSSHRQQPQGPPVIVVCISDTHNACPGVPDGDVLLHAGDLTRNGSFAELQAQLDWLRGLPHRHKVVIAGNHDLLLDDAYTRHFPARMPDDSGGPGTSRGDLDWGDIIYLQDSKATLVVENGTPSPRTLTVYGSPLTPEFGLWAFQYPPVRRVWPGRIPPNTDIVLTHGPPRGHLDAGGKGCPQLLRELCRTRPALVVFGHIHEGHGREDLTVNDRVTTAYNAVVQGKRGLLGVAAMAWWLLWRRLGACLPLWRAVTPSTHPAARTQLVNAAVTVGFGVGPRRKLREAIVVEL